MNAVEAVRQATPQERADLLASFKRGELELVEGVWNPAPAPRKGPYVIRNKGAKEGVHHEGNWLLSEIHGRDYEWSAQPYYLRKIGSNA